MEVTQPLRAQLGKITISNGVVAQIVGRVANEAYGVVGRPARGGRVGRLLTRDKLTQGIAVAGTGDALAIDVHVVVEYGLNLAEVAATLRSRVTYEVERLTGLTVASVEVHIEDVRQSA